MIRAIALPFAVLALAPAARAGDFQADFASHVAAVQGRDLKALEATLTSGEQLVLILPNGKMTRTRADYLAFHRAWFAETGWTIRFEPVATVSAGDITIQTGRTRYEDTIDGKPYWSESWLALTFRREDGGWKLIQDQNTRIRASTDAKS